MPADTQSIALTSRQKRCARYLAIGLGQRATARRMGMDERTVRRWLSDVPGFRELVDELRSTGANDEDAVNATDVLRDLLQSTDERIRLSAASALLKVAPAARADEDPDADLADGWE